ncbi:MAG: ABC transporter permease [Tannerella sp.]|jgi:putative ABC transport system permease protein|nr:ABC transporter permease [Tannerella sp.]
MKAIIVAFRSLFSKGNSHAIKIVSLGTGLAVGLALIAKVYFEQSYDDFFPDADRIFMICTNYSMGDAEPEDFPQVSGAIAPGMKAEIPEVEAATRMTGLGLEAVFFTSDRRKYAANLYLADTCLFDVFPHRILAGDPKDVLARPMYVMIARKVAERMGGVDAAMGQTIIFSSYPGRTLTVGGVFEDLPLNSHMNYSMLVSMPSIGQFTYDGSMNWVGNDRYRAYVRMQRGATPESVAPAIARMQEKNQPMDMLKERGITLGYFLTPLLDVHSGTDEVRRMTGLLAILAFVLIFTAVMNYVLIVISSLVGRTREMAVNKCYGASEANIYGKMLAETFADLTVSLLLAAGLLYACRGIVEDLLGAEIETLFNLRSAVWLAAVCLVVFLVSGLAPGYSFARVPVAAAFRNYRENKRVWKLALLFFQIACAGFLFSLLVVIARQYAHMIQSNPGYEYEQLAYSSLSGVPEEQRRKVIEEVARLPEVDRVTTCTSTLLGFLSGNEVSVPGDTKSLLHIGDLYWVGDGYLDMMGIPVVEGRSFTENVSPSHEVMVDRRFAEQAAGLAGWTDGVVGKSIIVSEHSRNGVEPFTICGVFENVRNGAIGADTHEPTVLFYRSAPGSVLLVKYHRQTPEAVRRTTETLERLLPDHDVAVYSYPAEMVNLYAASRRFRDAVMIGSLITLLITLIGLVGYTRDEINRRRKETAIRKINGATLLDVLRLFMTDVSRIALPAIAIGGGLSAYVAVQWQMQFSEKSALAPLLFVGCAAGVLLIVLFTVYVNCYRTANENPALSLKSE